MNNLESDYHVRAISVNAWHIAKQGYSAERRSGSNPTWSQFESLKREKSTQENRSVERFRFFKTLEFFV